jgi:hypothetical protein
MNSIITNFLNWLFFIRGLWRIKHGYCPMCNSDAPKIDDCNICYGVTIPFPPPKGTKILWRQKFDEFMKEMKLRQSLKSI